MTSIYPAQYLVIPLYAQERLPPAFQNVDLEILMVYHSVIGLIGSNFWVHEPWLFPLSLFGLIACCSSSQQLLSHFLAFWIASIPLDIVWLLYRSDQARSIMIFLMGINMCCKLVSGAQIARSLQTQGVIPDISSSTWGTSASSQQPWLNGGSTAPFGLPGSWSGQQGPYRDTEANPQPYQQSQQPQRTNPTSAPPYRSIYDEEANEDDAPQVRVENVANSVAAAAAAAAAAAKGSQNKEYNSTSNNR